MTQDRRTSNQQAQKRFRKNNLERSKEIRRNYYQNRRIRDPAFVESSRLRSRLYFHENKDKIYETRRKQRQLPISERRRLIEEKYERILGTVAMYTGDKR